MSPAVALGLMHEIMIGDILLETVDGRTLCLRRVARPNQEQEELLSGLGLTLPERLCADWELPRRSMAAAAESERSRPEM